MAVRYEVIVIGAGAAGCAAALEVTRLGLDVLLVDSSPSLGGGGLKRGTIPMATLREMVLQLEPGAESVSAAAQRALSSLVPRAQDVTRSYVTGLARSVTSAGVRVECGRARFRSPGEIWVEGHGCRSAAAVIVATGSRPRRPARFPFDDVLVCDSDSILGVAESSRSMLIVGSEILGCEFACLFAALGLDVTIVDRRRKLMRVADREILEVLYEGMQSLGIVLALEEDVERFGVDEAERGRHAIVKLSSGRIEKCDRVLVIAGREAEVETLDLDAVGVAVNQYGFIQVDERGRTSRPGVYAIGDVAGLPHRVGTAMYEARAAVLDACGQRPSQLREAPIAINTIPPVSVAGLGEQACHHLDIPYVVGLARFEELLQGHIRARGRGVLKLIARRTDGQLLGVQSVGEAAPELIHFGTCLLDRGSSLADCADSIFSFPSYSESYRVAALDAMRWR